MNERFRLALLGGLLAAGVGLGVVLWRARLSPPLGSSLTGTFQVIGAPAKLVDRAASRALPVGDDDEHALGDAYRRQFDAQVKPGDRDQRYCDEVLAEVVPFTSRRFPFRAYVIDGVEPNAMALPGGVVLVTRGMFWTVHSEAELASVLAHELGHVERGHCFDAVRFELLQRKLDPAAPGSVADRGSRFLFGHAFAKNQEHEADDYAFDLLRASPFDPRAEAFAFQSMLHAPERDPGSAGPANPLRDYFTSHPPLEIRAAEYGGRAGAWWTAHASERRYVGGRNLEERVAMSRQAYDEEWSR